jgi:GNAT superfamily N-acetyltransferase/catechol 2,3-dioxygenase-like lactoylglutathione lyase family enzyme
VQIRWYREDRERLRKLFALAEDSPRRLEAHLGEGRVLVAEDEGQIVAYLQVVDSSREGEAELQSIAVAEDRQGEGIGRALIERAIAECRGEGVRTLLVATGAADIGNLRFYQRLGFRMLSIERDAFTPAGGYPEGINVDGIPLRDRVWFSMALEPGGPGAVQLRIARHTERLDEVVRFYRDGVGLNEIGGFRGHDGYDGVFLAVPGTGTHLELTSGGDRGTPAPHPESLLVLYVGDDDTVRKIAARLAVDPVQPANPYWADHGVTFEDPDGFRVVLVPEYWDGG